MFVLHRLGSAPSLGFIILILFVYPSIFAFLINVHGFNILVLRLLFVTSCIGLAMRVFSVGNNEKKKIYQDLNVEQEPMS